MKKTVLLLITYFFMFHYSFAQEIEWQHTVGGSDNDALYSKYSVLQTSDGGYICGGSSFSNISGDKTENCLGGSDYWIVKLDAAGIIQWQNTIGGNDQDDLASISLTADGGYICGGSSNSNISGDKTENNLGPLTTSDYWVVKLDSTGNIQWQNTIGGSVDDWLRSVSQTDDGGYICGGFSKSNISGDKTENGLGQEDFWIVKLDSVGNIQWDNTIGGNWYDKLSTISQTYDGGYICGGYSNSNISYDKTENCFGLEDYWIVKIDSLGIIQWQKTIGGNNWDYLQSVYQTIDGGYVIAGTSLSNISGNKTENCLGNDDYWIVKLDSQGTIQWQNTIGGNWYDELYSISQTDDNGYIAGGWSKSNISGDKTENCIDTQTGDYWIVKLDSLGNIEWQNTIGGSSTDYLYSVSQTFDGRYICGGSSISGISFDKTENCLGQFDYWIIKLTGKFNSIEGKIFIDLNSNNIQDTSEPVLQNKKITEANTNRFAFSNQNGFYYVSVLDTGNYSVNPTQLNYYNTVPGTHSIAFSNMNQIDSLNDFAFQPAGVFNDLCVTITPLGRFRPGFNANYMINYENIGTITLTPTIIFFPDSNVSFVSSTPVASNVLTDSIVWSLPNLPPFETSSILVTINVNVGLPVGTPINSTVRIDPIVNDANATCNYAAGLAYTTNSIDPNAILVDQDTLFQSQLLSPPYLDYVVYFQNTGNDTAFTVKILNPIDTNKLDLSSFEFITSSHPVNLNWINYQRNMEFKFENILLPDSNVDEPMSHGFVRYKIKPKANLVAGDSIANFAGIYFDFNNPVLTNEAITRVVLSTGVNQFNVESLMLKIFPNPVKGQLTINCEKLMGENCILKVFDIYGRVVTEKQLPTSNHKLQTILDVSKFSNGIYIIELNDSTTILRSKFIKQ